MKLIGISIDKNEDDDIDDNAELFLEFRISHPGHRSPAEAMALETTDYINYNWDTSGGGLAPVDIELYSHDECTRMDPITITFQGWEYDSFEDNDDLGKNSHTFIGPEVITIAALGGLGEESIGTNIRISLELTVTGTGGTSCTRPPPTSVGGFVVGNAGGRFGLGALALLLGTACVLAWSRRTR